jgi:hypothetical protein
MGLAHAWTFRREEKSASILADAVAIRHPKELPGGIAELQKRGLKITYFEDSSQR